MANYVNCNEYVNDTKHSFLMVGIQI
jgi:hypothetical protein